MTESSLADLSKAHVSWQIRTEINRPARKVIEQVNSMLVMLAVTSMIPMTRTKSATKSAYVAL